MLVGLFKKIFNIRDKHQQPEFTGTSAAAKRQEQQAAKLNQSIASLPQSTHLRPCSKQESAVEVDLSSLFYSLLFMPQSHAKQGIANNLERQLINEIEVALSSVECIAETVLKLPSKIIELDKKLADESIDIKQLLALIEQDPLLSVEVLQLCNSPAFRRSEKDITSLQQALVLVGRVQLRRFVSTCLAREMINIKPIYFRRFGAEVWRHSMQVAFLASEIASESGCVANEQSETAFLLGLLHDVGKIAIFKMLIDAFHRAEPGEQPSSLLIGQVMTTKSLTLSALLAREWQLPQEFEANLALLANTHAIPQSGLAQVIWRANIISECSMLKQANKLPDATLHTLIAMVDINLEEFESLHQQLILF